MDEIDPGLTPEEPPEGLGVVDVLLQAVERNPRNVQQFQIVSLLMKQLDEMRLAANRAYRERIKRWNKLKLALGEHIEATLKENKDAGRTMLGSTFLRGRTKLSAEFRPDDMELAEWVVNCGQEDLIDWKPDMGAKVKQFILETFEKTGEIPPGVEIKTPHPIIVTRTSAKPDIRLLEGQAAGIANQHWDMIEKQDD